MMKAIYALLWGFDSTHLHAVMLQPEFNANVSPKPVFSSNPTSRAMFANFTLDGRIICRNFNGQKGCTLPNCNFAHECNRKVAGKGCGLPHPRVSHKP